MLLIHAGRGFEKLFICPKLRNGKVDQRLARIAGAFAFRRIESSIFYEDTLEKRARSNRPRHV